MGTPMTTYDIYLDGRLDSALLALVAEYDLHDLSANVALHGLTADAALLHELLDRARILGVNVVRIRRGDGGVITSTSADSDHRCPELRAG
jgi:DNA-nicking Smr family endonuclease